MRTENDQKNTKIEQQDTQISKIVPTEQSNGLWNKYDALKNDYDRIIEDAAMIGCRKQQPY